MAISNDTQLDEDLKKVVEVIAGGGPAYVKLEDFLNDLSEDKYREHYPDGVVRVKDSFRCIADIARTLEGDLPRGRLR